MSQKEIEIFGAALTRLMLSKGRQPLQGMVAVWLEDVEGYAIEIILEGIKKQRHDKDDWPSSAKLLDYCREIVKDRRAALRGAMVQIEDHSEGSKPISKERLAELFASIGKKLGGDKKNGN